MILSRLSAAALLGFFGLGPACAANLASYRAVYDMNLLRASDRSGLSAVDGRMVYEFRGSSCEGYAVKFRSVTAFRTDDSEQVIDQRATTFENVAEDRFSFATQSFIDNKLDKEVKGEATKLEPRAALAVSLTLPETQKLKLPNAMFPTAHMEDLLDRAAAGEKIYRTSVFDGTEEGDKILMTNVVIGDRKVTPSGDEDVTALGSLVEGAYWPISMSYYDIAASSGGEDEPVFRLSFDLYDNGVASDFTMDYGDFVVSQKLVELEPVETPACDGAVAQ